MNIVDDLGEPIKIELPVDVLGLLEISHIEVSVVIVPGVFFEESRGDIVDPLRRYQAAHVPGTDQFLAIGIVVRE